MELETPDAQSCLSYRCPYCGTVDVDAYEVLSPGESVRLVCDGCREHFNVLVLECPNCGDETAHTCPITPSASDLQKLSCQRCHHALIDDEDDLRSMD
ncbi:hypothetical protein [Ideonella sp. A 288]|uniref:hypothetical protein n=1 Tax=Ideonella sp. A 288 TaxID=1962181 RepID=UPI000B4A5957|nr:hypothetical protein [Ideonella sp. A 288]